MDELLTGMGMVLAVGIFTAFQAFEKHFGPEMRLRQEIHQLQSQLHGAEEKLAEAEDRHLDFKNGIRNLVNKGLDSEGLLHLTQSVRAPASEAQSENLLEVQLRLGLRQQKDGHYASAVAHFRRYLAVGPDAWQAATVRSRLIQCLIELGQSEKAIVETQEMVASFPEKHETADALLALGGHLIKLGRYDQAEEILETVQVFFPKDRDLVRRSTEMLKELDQ